MEIEPYTKYTLTEYGNTETFYLCARCNALKWHGGPDDVKIGERFHKRHYSGVYSCSCGHMRMSERLCIHTPPCGLDQDAIGINTDPELIARFEWMRIQMNVDYQFKKYFFIGFCILCLIFSMVVFYYAF